MSFGYLSNKLSDCMEVIQDSDVKNIIYIYFD